MHKRTEIESDCRGGCDDEGLQHQAACVSHDVFLQLLVLRVFILHKRKEWDVRGGRRQRKTTSHGVTSTVSDSALGERKGFKSDSLLQIC